MILPNLDRLDRRGSGRRARLGFPLWGGRFEGGHEERDVVVLGEKDEGGGALAGMGDSKGDGDKPGG
jgi:hypothetical protein